MNNNVSVTQIPMGFGYVDSENKNFLKTKNLGSCIGFGLVTKDENGKVDQRFLFHISYPMDNKSINEKDFINNFTQFILNMESVKNGSNIDIKVLGGWESYGFVAGRRIAKNVSEKLKETLPKEQKLTTTLYERCNYSNRYSFVIDPNGDVYISKSKSNCPNLYDASYAISQSEKKNENFLNLSKLLWEKNSDFAKGKPPLNINENLGIFILSEAEKEVLTTQKIGRLSYEAFPSHAEPKVNLTEEDYRNRLKEKVKVSGGVEGSILS